MQTVAISLQPFLFLIGEVSASIADSSSGGSGNLTGSVDPNGTVTGTQGQLYTQVSGGTSTIWVNMNGGTVWT